MMLRLLLFSLVGLLVHFTGAIGFTDFNPLEHTGPAAPYFDAPPRFNISNKPPPGCVVDQAAYIIRHGARFPEPGSFVGWQNLFNKFQNATYNATGDLNFIPSWVPPVDDVPHEPLFLTDHGATDAFRLGMELRGRYNFTAGGDNLTVWSAGQQRVIDTASYFLRGYFSQGNYLNDTSKNRGSIFFMPDSILATGADSLTASAACPLYTGENGTNKSNAFRASYQPAIAARLNAMLDGLTLNSSDISVMQDLCGFGFNINGNPQWCHVFTEQEWLDYEYANDLNYYYGSGPGNPLSGTTAWPWLKAITDIFSGNVTGNVTFTPPPLLIGTTHDNDIPPVIAALGILNSSTTDPSIYPLSPTTPNPNRTFFSSNIVNFLGHAALERLSCEAPLPDTVHHAQGVLSPTPGKGLNAQQFVRVLVNNAVVPIPACQDGPGGSCGMSDFVAYVMQRGEFLGDFAQKCNTSSNVSDVVDIYTNPFSPGAQAQFIELPVTEPAVGS